jgi:MoaA/NifB/PqqE/SkfB family radical SAM enzyme
MRLPLRWRFLLLAARRGKVAPGKLLNLLRNLAAYRFRRERAAAFPSVLIPEVTNRCNLACLHCREPEGGIVDYLGPGRPAIPLGAMRYDLYESVLEEAAPDLLAVVLYVSGESLLHPDLCRMVGKATELRVPTVLSTNGALLDGDASTRLLEAGIDCLKVVVGGFTRETYGRFHRGGDLDRVKRNLLALAEARDRTGSGAILALDFLVFPENEREAALAERFCRDAGIGFGRRAGFTVGADAAGKEKPDTVRGVPARTPCDWLWTIMTVGWDGRVLPCGNYAFSALPEVLGEVGRGSTVREAWNGARYRAFRAAHRKHGRGIYPLCERCHYSGIRFQY